MRVRLWGVNEWRPSRERTKRSIHLQTHHGRRSADCGYATSEATGRSKGTLETHPLGQCGRDSRIHCVTNAKAEKQVHQATYGVNMKPKRKTTVITIDSTLHTELRAICDKHGVKIGFLADQAVRELLAKLNNTAQVSTSLSAFTR